MATEQSDQNKRPGRVIFFPPRSSQPKGKAWHSGIAKSGGKMQAPVGDLSAYERRDETDDYPRRMMINLIAFAFVVMLTLAGVWLAETMALLRKNQDCALSGRSNCVDIGAELRNR